MRSTIGREDLAFPLEELLDAIRPSTRAILIANPNNPTGTGIAVEGIERILEKAVNAAVLIDEAYFEFNGVTALPLVSRRPNLFVSRTFSKVFGMAAMRLGCVFSQAANVAYLHKAQSPYSVNMLAALAATEAIRDKDYIANYVSEVLAARDLLYEGLDRLKIPYLRSQANFVLFQAGERAIEVRDKLREQGVLVRDRSYELAGCGPGHRGDPRANSPLSRRAGGDLVMPDQLLVFDMDGVLVDVTASYRETIRQTVRYFTGRDVGNETIQDLKNLGGWNDDWAVAQRIVRDLGVEVDYDTVVARFQSIFLGDGADGLMRQEKWAAPAGTVGRPGPPLPAGRLHGTPAARGAHDARALRAVARVRSARGGRGCSERQARARRIAGDCGRHWNQEDLVRGGHGG